MGVAYSAVLLIPIGLSFINPAVSFILYGLVMLGFFLATVSGRWELAMVWRPAQRARDSRPADG